VAAALPWCGIAPAALSAGGLAAAGLGLVVDRAAPALAPLSVALLLRTLHRALVARPGRPVARIIAVVAAVLALALLRVPFGATPG